MMFELLANAYACFKQGMVRWRQRQAQRELEARYGPDWLEKLTR